MCASIWSWPHGARLITAVLMLVLGLAKFATSWNTAHLSDADGGYYTNVAQHVRDGDGLETRVSLYHKAYSYFPHPTAVQPLWPLGRYVPRLRPSQVAGV